MNITDFIKKKDFLVCIDSDGTAMDTMSVKHYKCFGPCFYDEWQLGERQAVLDLWNDINLYRQTRGMNRFITLNMILQELSAGGIYVEGLETLEHWVNTSSELSNGALKEYMTTHNDEIFYKAMRWSLATNKAIGELTIEEKQAFVGVKEFLALAAEKCDIAIVSSANYQAIVDEWNECNLMPYADVVTSQNDGTKDACIAKLLEKGYSKSRVLMMGDAIPDESAADNNGVWYYPILPMLEVDSWAEAPIYLDKFVSDEYASVQPLLTEKFHNNFKG